MFQRVIYRPEKIQLVIKFKIGWVYSVFPNKVKISLDSGSCKLETFTRQKKFHQTVGGQWPIPTSWDQKNKTDQNITGL